MLDGDLKVAILEWCSTMIITMMLGRSGSKLAVCKLYLLAAAYLHSFYRLSRALPLLSIAWFEITCSTLGAGRCAFRWRLAARPSWLPAPVVLTLWHCTAASSSTTTGTKRH